MNPTARHAQMAAALAAMGFERMDSPPIPPQTVSTGSGQFKSSSHKASMGTLVSLSAVDEARSRAEEAFGRAFREMDRVVSLLNRYEEGSALSCLNAQGALTPAPPDLSEVMENALQYYSLTGGAFDVTVKPLVDLFRRRGLAGPFVDQQPGVDVPDPISSGAPGLEGVGPSSFPIPDPEIAETLEMVDGGAVKLANGSVRFERSGMGVTLDGIAKGYVVDRMAEVLSREGLTNWIINAGGDVRAAGVREDGSPWHIGVQDPQKRGDLPDVIHLSEGAVATSGSYEVYFDQERTSHHIVSTRTGRSPVLCQSASVVAPSAMAADTLATTLFVMGPEKGIPFIDSLPQCASLIVDAHGRKWRSRRWRSTLTNTRKAGQT